MSRRKKSQLVGSLLIKRQERICCPCAGTRLRRRRRPTCRRRCRWPRRPRAAASRLRQRLKGKAKKREEKKDKKEETKKAMRGSRCDWKEENNTLTVVLLVGNVLLEQRLEALVRVARGPLNAARRGRQCARPVVREGQ